MRYFIALYKRDISLTLRNGASLALGPIFYLCLIILFPFGVGPNMKNLSLISPAVIWAGPLLATLIGLETVLQPDKDDGSLDLYKLSGHAFEGIILAKAAAFWTVYVLPLIFISPLFAMMLGMEGPVIIGSVTALMIGSPALVFFGTLCAALTLHLKRAGLMIVILAVPLLVPTLIFGVTASTGLVSPTTPFTSPLMILGAISIFSGCLCAVVGARILR